MSDHRNPRWWEALNPPIYLVSILPGLGVWLLARTGGSETYVLAAATLAVVLLQHMINVLNDVSDWRLGADEEKWESWVRFHRGNIRAATFHGWVSFVAGGLIGLGTLIDTDKLWILGIALPMVGLGYLYNSGRRPLSYTRLGEWVTGLCYGPGVVGCLWLLIGQPIGLAALLAAIAFGALAVALLLSHQPPQIDTDRRAGKHSFAVRYGATLTYRISRVLLGVFLFTFGGAFVLAGSDPWLLVLLLAVAASIMAVVSRPGLGPKRILLSATGFVAVMVASNLTLL